MSNTPQPQSIYEFSWRRLNDHSFNTKDLEGKVVLIVNTASRCGFTPQYKGLEALYQKYAAQGLLILGFPCNDFGQQEPGSADEISEFCQINYGVSFPIMEKIHVKGKEQHPLFTYLTETAPGILGTKAVKWNFTKFLVNKKGQVVKRFAPNDEPESISADIEKLIKES